MTLRDLSEAKNPDLRNSLTALHRAAAMARKAAIDSGTELVIVVDGRLVHVKAEELREPSSDSKPSA